MYLIISAHNETDMPTKCVRHNQDLINNSLYTFSDWPYRTIYKETFIHAASLYYSEPESDMKKSKIRVAIRTKKSTALGCVQ